MRAVLLALAIVFAFVLPARADRVMEVQNIHIDGSPNRDAAVAEATKQAAAQVWSKLGHTTPLPDLSPTQLQGISSYVDVANEVAQPNYYAANFNIGIQVGALTRAASGQNVAEAAPPVSDAYNPAQPAPVTAANEPPSWVLIIPGRENAGTVSLWNLGDEWAKAWQRAPLVGISTAVTSGADPADAATLSPEMVQNYNPALADKLHALARKYNAPAIALVLLSSQRPEIAPNEEVQVEITYLESDMPEALTAQSTLFVTAASLPQAYGMAVAEGQKLLGNLANGGPVTPVAAPATPYQPYAQPGQFGNTYAAAPTAAMANKLWVRIPLATPMDLANYRRRIEAIPGARFEIIALNRMYVEGNILYTGDQNSLMQQLAAAGLRQQ